MAYVKDRIAAGLLLALAAAVFIASGDLPTRSMIFPRMITAVMAIGAVLLFLRTISFRRGRAPAAADDPKLNEPFFRNPVHFAITIAALFAYLVAIEWLGYFVATITLIVTLSLALGFRNLPLLAGATVLFVALVYGVFVLIFERPLPRGIFM